MRDQVIAYLVGGPFDLTKRIVDSQLYLLHMAEIEVMDLSLYDTEALPNESVPMTIHVYRRVGWVTDCDQSGRRIGIYNYEGLRK